ncbi:hypothetical protein OnM2_064036 [Erysiphe neolycopersici]|uniref:Uncharacterized protein n=1 Tax=Erysiphe neolycopersici TaxID=212602 RepID=A0A420HNH0_9PEZI|nr:hypothetical protein OnM2_064036 [Erysiphe neolycopersici]
MNTVKSFWVGWGALCVAGGGAYYFAKKSINADKMARFEAEQKRKRFQNSLNHSSTNATQSKDLEQRNINDPSVANFNPNTEREKEEDKSKCEPVRPFRSLKGDRFS